VDYALFGPDGSLIAPTFHYRDARTARGVEKALAKAKWEEIFAETGIQFMPLNTLFQLAAETPERLKDAAWLLGIGDAFNYLLSGVARAEESLASTFQLYNPRLRNWSKALLDALGLPRGIFPPIIPSGTKLGVLRSDVARGAGLGQVEVLATCSHDTGAAVGCAGATTWDLGLHQFRHMVFDGCQLPSRSSMTLAASLTSPMRSAMAAPYVSSRISLDSGSQ
jgi:rhamnulokinase